MQNPRLAGRYAKSLVMLAQEQHALDAVHQDMKYLAEVCRQSREFTNVLRSPVIKGDKKEAIVAQVINSHVGKLTSAFIHLLIQKGRESNLPEIARAFIEQYNEIMGIHRVKLTTAFPASEELKTAIVNKVKADTPLRTIELENEVNEALIGGYQLEYNGNLVDASIARDLRDIRKQFQTNVYIPDIR
ncbi:MAG TPA: ATP synthase F1 subunit delta [Lacibacter sp.]|nr:ATP synthase F1 subunit delta [Lacibacter sp.]HMO88767.1 ATP synthase F1 subunit delta [Lacibacter sp.]HMP85715.1 ATP synthase F1 subunit delta [Lacibacter sp.]